MVLKGGVPRPGSNLSHLSLRPEKKVQTAARTLSGRRGEEGGVGVGPGPGIGSEVVQAADLGRAPSGHLSPAAQNRFHEVPPVDPGRVRDFVGRQSHRAGDGSGEDGAEFVIDDAIHLGAVAEVGEDEAGAGEREAEFVLQPRAAASTSASPGAG